MLRWPRRAHGSSLPLMRAGGGSSVICTRRAGEARARGDRAEARVTGAVERRRERHELVAEALRHAEQANSELRELAHGILPEALTRDGLRAGLEELCPISRYPWRPRCPPAPPGGVVATAYFVVSEALTNVVKHARATRATVTAQVDDGLLRLEIRDDGVGGADFGGGSGMVGLNDRVEALGGTLKLVSPTGEGTTLLIEIPVRVNSSAS